MLNGAVGGYLVNLGPLIGAARATRHVTVGGSDELQFQIRRGWLRPVLRCCSEWKEGVGGTGYERHPTFIRRAGTIMRHTSQLLTSNTRTSSTLLRFLNTWSDAVEG